MGLSDREYMKMSANQESFLDQARKKLESVKSTLHNKWKGLSSNKKLLASFGAGLAVGGLAMHFLSGRKKQNST